LLVVFSTLFYSRLLDSKNPIHAAVQPKPCYQDTSRKCWKGTALEVVPANTQLLASSTSLPCGACYNNLENAQEQLDRKDTRADQCNGKISFNWVVHSEQGSFLPLFSRATLQSAQKAPTAHPRIITMRHASGIACP